MERVENIKKEILSSKKAKYIIGTLLLCGMGIALPRIFHVLAGNGAGETFLPMHICVLIAALVFGGVSSSLVAGSSIIGSYFLTGMPSLERLPYMVLELVIYAIMLSILNKRFHSYISLIVTIILGRILYAGILMICVNTIGFSGYGISVLTSVKVGMPGIVIQLFMIPFIAERIKERLNLKDE